MKKKYFIGIDIGGTKILAGIADINGNIAAAVKQKTPKINSAAEVVKCISGAVKELLEESKIPKSSVKAIGVAVPGIVDSVKGKVIFAPNLKLRNIALAGKIAKTLKLPAVIGNDVNLGLLGEKLYGSAKNYSDIIAIFWGTGIGGGIMIGGKLLSGRANTAGEIGHMKVAQGGNKCSCGESGCLEAYAGRWAIEKEIRKYSGRLPSYISKAKKIKSGLLRKALNRNEPAVTKIMKNSSIIVGEACKTLIHILDPQVIIIGGGVTEACGNFTMPIIQQTVKGDKLLKNLPKCKIVKSKLLDNAVLLGAAGAAAQKTA